MATRSREPAPAWPWVLLVFAGLMALWIWLGSYMWTHIFWALRQGLFWMLPLIGLVVLIAVLLVVSEDHPGFGVLSVLVGLAAVVGFIWWVSSIHAYMQNRDYMSSVRTTDAPVSSFAQRAPMVIAQNQAKTDLGSVSGADLSAEDTMYVPGADQFTTLVKGRSALGNYAAVEQQNIPLVGHGKGTTCRFSPDADRVDGGWFAHAMGRLVNSVQRGVLYDANDMYGYCQGNTPMVVMPLREQTGVFVVTERPAGVALYNGSTGQLTIQDTGNGIPGPTYPLSLAAQQRVATDASGSYWDFVFGRAGYQTTDANGDPDVNSSNSAEFVLQEQGQRGEFVTPLTGQGSSTSIVGISETPMNLSRPDELAPLTVHRLHPGWTSTAALESRIKADYQDLPNWQNLVVEELAPYSPNHWVATIANQNGQNILYRVRGTGDLSDFPGARKGAATCLYDGASDTPIRCGTLALQGGNGVGTQYGPGQSAPGAALPPGLDLSKLTPAQLAQLNEAIARELDRRLSQPGR